MSHSIHLDPARSALLIVDMQPDFMPGGALPVAGGDLLVPPIRALMEADLFPLQVATQDWHPPSHISFASAHPGRRPFDEITLHGQPQTLWPDHCVQGSDGARLHEGLALSRLSAILRKGMDPRADSYSGFRNNWDGDGQRRPTGLAGYLHERGVDSVVVCGLARDVCVAWTAEDAVAAGLHTYLVWDLTCPVHPGGEQALREGLVGKGVVIVEAAALLP